jgi:membrane peptidoglycan carboxypeptidase
MALPFLGSAAFAVRQASVTFDSLPQELKSLPLPQRTYLETNNGKVFATLYEQNRVVVPLSKISTKIQEAAIATEDVRYYEHNGVDLKGSARALVANSQAGDVQQGSSTITMQYVRNLLITNAADDDEIEQARVRTIGRKLQEMRYALALEKKMTKEEILQGYLNVSYFGAGAYGVEAAAKRYFNTSADKVSLPQAATLAGLFQQPVGYDPTLNPKISQIRRNVVLDRMEQAGFITFAEAGKAKLVPIKKTLNPQKNRERLFSQQLPLLLRIHGQPD